MKNILVIFLDNIFVFFFFFSEVTKLLQFIAQASHELVPPDVLEPVLQTLVNNFITERNSADVMAIGYNISLLIIHYKYIFNISIYAILFT